MSEQRLFSTIDRKFQVIEDKLRNSFQAIKKDKEEMEKKISVLSSNLNKIGSGEEIGELRAYFQKEINFLKEKVSENAEKTEKLDSKIDKTDIKSNVRKEIEPIFDKKIEKQREKSQEEKEKLEKRIKELENEFNSDIRQQELNTERTIDKIENSLRKLQEEFERKISNSEKKNLEEIKTLKRQIVYLKGRSKGEKVELQDKKGFLTKIVDGLAD